MLADVFANLAAGFSAQYGAPYMDGSAVWQGTPTLDDGGSITTPGTPVSKSCKVQVSAPTTSMRAEEGFRETDMRLHVLAGPFDGALDADAAVVVANGLHAGQWSIESITLDSAGIGWTCRGRKAS